MALLCGLAACRADPGGSSAFESAAETAAMPDDAGSSAAGDDAPASTAAGDSVGGHDGADAADEGSTGADTDGIKFDVPPDAAGPGCQKVDFLFAIDNSGSMGGFQQNLADSFPGFIAAIEAGVAAQDYRILVTDSDGVATMGPLVSGCGLDGTCASICGGCGYGDVCVCTCDDPATECVDASASCDDTHGAGVTRDVGGGDCGVAGGHRYMTQTQPDLEGTFACLALVGDYGMALERPVTAAIKAITTESAPGGCNEGFVRDDALLVVTLITDDPAGVVAASQYEDAGYLANADAWFSTFVDVKGGNPDNVVMLGILDASHGADVFVEFVDKFGDRGLIGDIEAANYTPFFEAAVGLVDTACDEFEPEG